MILNSKSLVAGFHVMLDHVLKCFARVVYLKNYYVFDPNILKSKNYSMPRSTAVSYNIRGVHDIMLVVYLLVELSIIDH